jgi:hypothetical protein
MDIKYEPTPIMKPLAGLCKHRWRDQESPYLVSQVCEFCHLYRYRVAPISDWEYRAPIPRVTYGLEGD